MCNTCFMLQEKIHTYGAPLADKSKASKDLMEHIKKTYLGRQIYWNLRWVSRCFGDVLVIIIDAMDKSKFAWPRWPGHSNHPRCSVDCVP